MDDEHNEYDDNFRNKQQNESRTDAAEVHCQDDENKGNEGRDNCRADGKGSALPGSAGLEGERAAGGSVESGRTGNQKSDATVGFP